MINEPNINSAILFHPESNYGLSKYMDITKFLSLLQNNGLFFCRIDKLQDKFEGTFSKVFMEFLTREYKRKGLTDNQIKERLEFQKNLRPFTLISCWSKIEIESAALWQIYSKNNLGIMLKTSVEKLKKSFSKSSLDVDITEVKYINFNHGEMINRDNTNVPFLYKHESFYFEEEIRLLYEIPSEYHQDKDYWLKQKIEDGIIIENINLDILIDEIIVSPNSPNWFLKMIEELLTQYGINKKVHPSKLTKID